MSYLRVISDIHGHYQEYLNIIKDAEYSVQLGDFGFNYDCLNNVDPYNQRILKGNHDNYDLTPHYEHFLPDYGPMNVGPFQFFGIRGGFSIDKVPRIKQFEAIGLKTWWHEEQLDHDQRVECFQSYQDHPCDVVLTHSCPSSISKLVGGPGVLQAFGWPSDMISSTQQLLEDIWNIRQPKLWIFGHFHKDWLYVKGNTTFICMKELGYLDFNENWEIV